MSGSGSYDVNASVDLLAGALDSLGDQYLVVVTGAGVSIASGIPTFRGTDPGAVWKRDVTELGTYAYFCTDPVGSWQWYTSRFDHVLDKSPNQSHHALAAIERWHMDRGGRFLLVTQNVDTLHENAGSRQMIKVHGSSDRARCIRSGCEYGAPSGSVARREVDMGAFFANPCVNTLPKCRACGALLRQHVLWFDEYYDGHNDYQWDRVMSASAQMSLVLFVGTSFAVGVTDLFLQNAWQAGTPAFSIDPAARENPHPALSNLQARSETLLPAVCRRLDIDV